MPIAIFFANLKVLLVKHEFGPAQIYNPDESGISTDCSSRNNKVLLIMENHDTHVKLEAVDLARGSAIVILTLPPYCRHKLQPLDRAVFGFFK